MFLDHCGNGGVTIRGPLCHSINKMHSVACMHAGTGDVPNQITDRCGCVRVVLTSAAGSKAEKQGVKMDYVAVHAKEGS